MTTYIALLRGVNMAGHKSIKMADLRKCFESLLFKNVHTYIQSGNVLFDSVVTDRIKLVTMIEKCLKKSLAHDIEVFLRSADEIKKIVRLNPFKNVTTHSESRMFVTFVDDSFSNKRLMPFWSDKKDVEVLLVKNREFFSLSHEVNGRNGSPNNLVEKKFKVSATTRNWRTVAKLVTLTKL
jgi:uncharacterized protein (DUF1697 family)